MEAQEIHLRDYYRILKKRKFTIFTFLVVTVTIVTIVTFTMSPRYRASTKMLIEKNESNPLENVTYTRWDPEFLETQYQIIKSYNVARNVVRTLSLDTKYKQYFFKSESEKPEFIQEMGQSISDLFSLVSAWITTRTGMGLSENQGDRKAIETAALSDGELLAEYLIENVEITPVRNSRIVEVAFSEQSPVLAAMIANTFAKAYMDEVLEMNMSVSNRMIKWTKKKTDEERIRLEQSERKLQKYMRDNDIITVENKIAIIPEKLQQFSSKLSEATEKRKELEEIVNKINRFKTSDELETLAEFSTNDSLR
ncbi:MAG: Wzz/FepE/Etk N-terminal domain-containing protein, partial [bacterium]